MKRYIWLICLLGLLVPATVLGQSQLHWEQYDNLVQIQRDGSVRVEERQILVVDENSRNRITRTFNTGGFGRVSDIQVTVDGQSYRPGSTQPGTFSGGDDGQKATIRVNYADPSADQHSITLAYTLKNSLVSSGSQAALDWNFFWSGSAPEIRNGSVEIRFPATVTPQIKTSGPQVRQTSTSDSVRLELAQPVRGQQLRIVASFPRTLLADTAQFRGASAPANSQPIPATGPVAAPAPGASLGFGNLFFCLIVLFFLFIAFNIMRASARGRRSRGYSQPPVYGPDPFDPFGGRRRRFRRRGYGGWGIPFFPPVIIPPSRGQRGPDTPFDNGGAADGGSGGGFNSWGDSGGGASSWGDSGGGASSWGDSGGGGSSWSDMGGGGGGGGGDSGGGGSGGGSFG